MAYSELIKNFERIRDYMRQFYVYGFKSRSEYNQKSARSYDNERRRIESWLGEYMSFSQTAEGKNIFISVDSRAIASNPLHNAFKAKSFTDGDIIFHFYVLDLLQSNNEMSVREITDEIVYQYLSNFDTTKALDESTVRKKLKEYEKLGLLTSCKHGKELFYQMSKDDIDINSWFDAISFYSEENPLGVIGSFFLNRYNDAVFNFRFKHHYILHALDIEILCNILLAINEKRIIKLTIKSVRTDNKEKMHTVYPMKIYISTQSGRQYLLCYHYKFKKPMFFRLDTIHSVELSDTENESPTWYDKFKENLWGVSTGVEHNIDHIEITFIVNDNEPYILDRLNREKRNGSIEKINENNYKYAADVYDASEMLPWIRTFIGRIKNLECTNQYVVKTFYQDLDEMNNLYGCGGDAIQ